MRDTRIFLVRKTDSLWDPSIERYAGARGMGEGKGNEGREEERERGRERISHRRSAAKLFPFVYFSLSPMLPPYKRLESSMATLASCCPGIHKQLELDP